MGHSRKINWDEVVDLWRQGYTVSEIAAEVGAKDPKYIRQVLRTQLSAEELSQTTGVDKGKIKALRKAGWTISSIAFEMQLPREKVKEILNELHL